jgi:NodT family efflux transporter outer membrane factor (OMF) lipoprotein
MHRSTTSLCRAAIRRLGLALAIVVGTEGCTVGPHYHAPEPPTVTSYTLQPLPSETVSSPGPAGESQHFNSSAQIRADWWTVFHSSDLNRMVDQALKNSPTLAEATAKLKQAQEELAARTGASKYPTVTGNASIQEQQLNLSAYGIPFPNPSPFTLLNGSVAVSYALDLFGANRRLIEGLRAERDYQAWQLEGARLMLAGNVVSAALRQAQLRENLQITRHLVELQNHQLEIAEQRLYAGGISEYDVRNQRTAVAQTEASIPSLEEQLDSIDHQIAFLMGFTPTEARIPEVSLNAVALPDELPLSIPSALVRQRPDIRAAEAVLHQASANVGVATANLYPQIVLTGSGGGLGTKFTAGGDVWNVGSALTQPIYNGGALRAEKRKAQDAFDEASAVYRRTVLQSFREVADSLRAIQHDAETLRTRTTAADQAADAYRIATRRYEAGGISETNMLDTQRQQLETALDRTNATAARFVDSATLIETLGGGWWNQSISPLTK